MGRWFKGILTGGLIGFVGGLLFAPQKGDKTRKQVKEFTDKAKASGEELIKKGEKFISGISGDISEQ
jgi:gas vesicle protein